MKKEYKKIYIEFVFIQDDVLTSSTSPYYLDEGSGNEGNFEDIYG